MYQPTPYSTPAVPNAPQVPTVRGW
jgi:hypothetical protein